MLTSVTAHSGCENTAPNSLAHVRAAIGSGAEIIEIDIRRTPDGLLYLSHDSEIPAGECLSFREFLEAIRPSSLRVNADLKADGLLRPVYEEAQRMGLADRLLFTGNTAREADAIRALSPDGALWRQVWINADRGGTDAEKLETAFAFAGTHGCPVVNLHHGLVTDESLRRIRLAGRDFSVWTCDTEELLCRMLRAGAANITTRKPRLALALRNEIQGK